MIIRVCHIHFYGIILEFTLYHQEQTALSPSTRTGNVTPISSLARMLLGHTFSEPTRAGLIDVATGILASHPKPLLLIYSLYWRCEISLIPNIFSFYPSL